MSVGKVSSQILGANQIPDNSNVVDQEIVFGPGLRDVDRKELIRLFGQNSTYVPASTRKDAVRILASNSFFIDISKNTTAPLEEIDAVRMLAAMLRTRGLELEDKPKGETIRKNIVKYKQYLCDMHRISDNEITKENMYILSPAVQKMIMIDSIEWNRKVEISLNKNSNDFMQSSPGGGIKIRMKKAGYSVNGLGMDGDRIIVRDPSLSIGDIQSAIKCFGESRYHIEFADPNFASSIMGTLVKMRDSSSGEEKELLSRVVTELNRKTMSKEEGLEEKDIKAIKKMFLSMDGVSGKEREQYALSEVYKNQKKVPGLSFEDQEILRKLAEALCTEGMPLTITLGNEYVAGNPAQQKILNEGIEVLKRIALELAAVAEFADIKGNRGFSGMVMDAMKGQWQVSHGGQEDFRAVANGLQDGYMLVLKWGLFPDYVKKLDELYVELFGKDGKAGLLKDLDDYRKKYGQIQKLYARLMQIRSTIEARGGAFESEAREFNDIQAQIQALIRQSKGVDEHADTKINEKLGKYLWYTRYLMSDEIDYQFLYRFREKFSKLVSERTDLKDPYTLAVNKYSLADLIYKKGPNGPSLCDRFKDGEKWSTLSIAVGEGKKSDNIVLAKQALTSAISSLFITKDQVNWLKPGVWMAAQFISRTPVQAGVQVLTVTLPGMVQKLGFTLPDTGNVEIGANSWDELDKNGVFAKALRSFNRDTGIRSNSNYGLIWKSILSQSVEDKFKFFHDNLHDDSVRFQNNISAANVEEIKKYVESLYITLDNAIEKEGDAGKREYLISAKKRLKCPDQKAVSEALKSLISELRIKIRTQTADGKVEEKSEDRYSFDLLESHMPLSVYDPGDVKLRFEKGAVKPGKIQEGAEVLRKLLADSSAILGAVNKETEKVKTPQAQDPVVDAFFGKDENGVRVPRQIVVMKDPGELKPESKPLTLADITTDNFGLFMKDYFLETIKEAGSFKYMMPQYNIPAGFFQTASLLGEGKLGPKDMREQYWEMGMNMGIQTAASFLFWEYDPLYAISTGISNWKKGQRTTALADFTISGPFSMYAFRRLGTLVGTPTRWILGLPTMSIDEFINNQGMTLGLPMRMARGTYQGISWVNAHTFKINAQAPKGLAETLLNQSWRYNNMGGAEAETWLGSAAEKLEPATRFFTGVKGGVVRQVPTLAKWADHSFDIVFNDVLNLGAADKTLNFTAEVGKAIGNRFFRKGVTHTEAWQDAQQYLSEMISSNFAPEIQGSFASAVKEQFKGQLFRDLLVYAKANGMNKNMQDEIASEIVKICEAEIKQCSGEMLEQVMGSAEGGSKLSAGQRLRVKNLLDKLTRIIMKGGTPEQLEKTLQETIMTSFQQPEWQEEFTKAAKIAKSKISSIVKDKLWAAETPTDLAQGIISTTGKRLGRAIDFVTRIKTIAPENVNNDLKLIRMATEKLANGMLEGKNFSACVKDIAREASKMGKEIDRGTYRTIRTLCGRVYRELSTLNPIELKDLARSMRLQDSLAPLRAAESQAKASAVEAALKRKQALSMDQAAVKVKAPRSPQPQLEGEPVPVFGANKGAVLERPVAAETPAASASKALAVRPTNTELTPDEIKLAEKEAKDLLSQLRKNIPAIIEKLEKGIKLTRLEESSLINMLAKVELKNFGAMCKFLSENLGALKLGGKALGALKILSEIAGPILVVAGIGIGLHEKWDDLKSGDRSVRAMANTELLKGNTVGMFTGLISIVSGAGGAIVSKVRGRTFKEGFSNTYGTVDGAMEKGLQWADGYLELGKGFQYELEAMDWLFDKTIGEEGIGGWLFLSEPRMNITPSNYHYMNGMKI